MELPQLKKKLEANLTEYRGIKIEGEEKLEKKAKLRQMIAASVKISSFSDEMPCSSNSRVARSIRVCNVANRLAPKPRMFCIIPGGFGAAGFACCFPKNIWMFAQP